MTAGPLRYLIALLMLVFAGESLCLLAGPPVCRFCCPMSGPTLTEEVNGAALVLYGTFTNAIPGAVDGQGTTDLQIEAVIKNHEILGDKKVLTLPRYIGNKDPKIKFLVFCDVFKGKVDPYRGIPVQADCDLVKYLKGALEIKDKTISARLLHTFEFLDNLEIEISLDAFKEFAKVDYKDYRDMAAKLPAEKIAKRLTASSMTTDSRRLNALLLGRCGTAKHADLLRKIMDDPTRCVSPGLDGMIAGYTMLKPKEGMAYIRKVLQDPSKEFIRRYEALEAVRFFWTSEPNVLDLKELIQAECDLLDQGDIADLAIEDLRHWGRWELCDRILGLQAKPSHDVPIIRRAMLRYALTCPGSKAAAYVQQCRKRDADMVKDAEELLKLETRPPQTPPQLAANK